MTHTANLGCYFGRVKMAVFLLLVLGIAWGFECRAQKPASRVPLVENETALAARIKQAAGWNDKGFVKRVSELPPDLLEEVEAESDPDRVSWDRQGPFWKEVLQRVANNYKKCQEQANAKRGLAAARIRNEIEHLFARRLTLRGGGSASWEMWVYLPSHVDWIIGHMD